MASFPSKNRLNIKYGPITFIKDGWNAEFNKQKSWIRSTNLEWLNLEFIIFSNEEKKLNISKKIKGNRILNSRTQ